MDVFLIRHTKAADGALYGDDGERPLTPDGRRAALDVGAALARHGVKLDAVVSSPLVRAVETAELVAVQIGFDGALDVKAALVPEGRPEPMIDLLRHHRDGARVALVGHLPSMGHLLAALLGRGGGLSMSKGAVARLSWKAGAPAKLVWVVTPKRLDPVASLEAL
jgi:phosphohistidine phosphatase